jgi:hypothetical protein
MTPVEIAAGINDTGGKFSTGINATGGKFCHPFPCVVDTGGKFATGVNDTGSNRYQRHRRQIMGTISGCRHLKVNLKTKIYLYVSSTTQR